MIKLSPVVTLCREISPVGYLDEARKYSICEEYTKKFLGFAPEKMLVVLSDKLIEDSHAIYFWPKFINDTLVSIDFSLTKLGKRTYIAADAYKVVADFIQNKDKKVYLRLISLD